MKYCYGLCFVMLLASCQQKQQEASMVIDIGSPQKVALSKVIDSFDYILLEDKEFIRKIFKIKIGDSGFYVHDDVTEQLFKFNHQGKFQFHIDRKGKGPGEYVQIYDFFLHPEQGFFILGNRKKLWFDQKGNFFKETDIESWSGDNHFLNEHVVVAFNTPGGLDNYKHYLYFWDDGLNELKKKELPYLKYKDKFLGVGLYPFSNYQGHLNFCYDAENIVYAINPNTMAVVPKYQLNFTHFKWADEATHRKAYNNNIFEWRKVLTPHVMFLRFIETNRYCYIGFSIKDKRKNAFYHKKDKKVICADEFIDDIGLGTDQLDIVGHHDGFWYAVINTEQMNNIQLLKENGCNITKKMNYLLLKFTLK